MASFHLLVGALLAVLALQPTDCDQVRLRDFRDYLIRDESTKTNILHALTDLSVTDQMSPKEIGERIATAAAHTHPFRHIYLALAELTDTQQSECSPETVSICFSIMSQSHLQAYKKFVEASRDRFHKCALENERKILDHIRSNSRMRQIVRSLEQFMRVAMGAPKELQGGDFVKELKKFDMTNRKLKSRQLIAVVDRSKIHFSRGMFDFFQPPIARVERFLDDRCMPFRFVLRNWLDSINLDLLLGNELVDPEIDRISEFHRICVDWVLKRPRISKNLWKGFLSI